MEDSKLNLDIKKLYEAIKFEIPYLKEEGLSEPNSEAISKTIKLLTDLAEIQVHPFKIATTVEEGIALIFDKCCERMYVEIYNDGDISYIIEDKKEKYLVENENLNSIEELYNKVKLFKGK